MRIKKHNLQIDEDFCQFIDTEVLPGTGMSPDAFWRGLAGLVQGYSRPNRELLARRDTLQQHIDDWHRANPKHDQKAYTAFLHEIGYLEPPPETIEQINPQAVDLEVLTPAPQLVVPITNARFALNAVNARWGSLYDALYAGDIFADLSVEDRADQIIAYGWEVLDRFLPLSQVSHALVVHYSISDGMLMAHTDDLASFLVNPEQFVGYRGNVEQPSSLLLSHNGLHIELVLSASQESTGRGITDIILESALTVIQDFEDSVVAVDAEDKIVVYRNWLRLMQGKLECAIEKNGQHSVRRLNADREYCNRAGQPFTLSGRALMFARTVGHLMTTAAVYDDQGQEVFEGILDAWCTTVIALHDLQKRQTAQNNGCQNSKEGSIYLVKPKMHGAAEVRFTCDLLGEIERLLALPQYGIKLGIMDEERRTTLNLAACIAVAKERVVFINTGFLDRTADEIHTSMLIGSGAVPRKAELKTAGWNDAYERWNVACGLEYGFRGRAQIGKGMWTMPDAMAQMLEKKHEHPASGASTAWVPSATAAVLHALHYHQIDVLGVQARLSHRQAMPIDALLSIPVQTSENACSAAEIQEELDNNAQGILGYVVRWIDQGIGCSKVSDIHGIALMEDRATLRISSQHICNWLHHRICSRQQVEETFARMAAVVDAQNSSDPSYQPLLANPERNYAMQAAFDLVFRGKEQTNGYTEPILHHWRCRAKNAQEA